MVTLNDSVELVLENLPPNVWPIIGRKQIPLTVAIPQNMADQFTFDSARAVIDMKKFKRGDRRILPLVTGLPPFSKVISIDSVRVKF
jgi:hypothetical protein